MAHGEVATIERSELPKGAVITTSGRISAVTEPGDVSVHYPFPIKDLVVIAGRQRINGPQVNPRNRKEQRPREHFRRDRKQRRNQVDRNAEQHQAEETLDCFHPRTGFRQQGAGLGGSWPGDLTAQTSIYPRCRLWG